MALAPPKILHRIILTLALCIGILKPVQGLCGCAERFASDSDLTNDTSAPYFQNKQNGETIIFSSARFHCATTLTKIKYNGQLIPCQSNCSEYTYGGGKPLIQLWRPNQQDTSYNLTESIELKQDQDSIDLTLSVSVGDVIGLWVPSICACTGYTLRIGYLYDGSRTYTIEGEADSFDTQEYKLERGPLPMIAVETVEDLNAVCMIGLPTGAIISLIALGFTCAGICWSITQYNKKVARKGKLVISHPLHEEEEGTELGNMSGNEVASNLEHVNSTVSLPISERPLPPIPMSNIDDEDELPNDNPPQLPYNGSASTTVPYTNVTHSMSNPDLTNAHQYGNISGQDDPRRFMSLERQHPQPKARASVRSYQGYPSSYSPRTSIDHQPQPNGYQPSGYQPNGYQPNGNQPHGYQPNGNQPHGYQPNGYQPNGNQPPASPAVGGGEGLHKQQSVDQGVPNLYSNDTNVPSPPSPPPSPPDDDPAMLSMVGSLGPQPPSTPPPTDPLPPAIVPEQDEVIHYDRNSEYEVSDDEAGEVEDEYLSIQRPDSVNTDGYENDAVYY